MLGVAVPLVLGVAISWPGAASPSGCLNSEAWQPSPAYGSPTMRSSRPAKACPCHEGKGEVREHDHNTRPLRFDRLPRGWFPGRVS